MHREMGGYDVTDIKPAVAFDVNACKVGLDLSDAIFAPPNNAYRVPDIELPESGVEVLMGPVADGAPPHLQRQMERAVGQPVDVVAALREAGAEVMLNMLPTGSAEAARIYAEAALEAGVAFVNGMPELIVCDESFAREAEMRKVPLVGDDVKSQLGGTILHRAMVETLHDAAKYRGATLEGGSYVDVHGQPGGYDEYLNVFKQAGRNGRPCPRCHRPIQKYRFRRRWTYYCEQCQI